MLINKSYEGAELHDIPLSILLSFVSLIIPVYFSQKAIEKIGSQKAVLVFSFTPLATAILEIIVLENRASFSLFFGFVFAMSILVFSFIQNILRKKI